MIRGNFPAPDPSAATGATDAVQAGQRRRKFSASNPVRDLALGFLPLLIYVVAEWAATRMYGEQKGLLIGLACAIALGSAQFLLFWRLEGRPDKLVLLDTALLLVFGAVSLALTDPVFFKLKPAVIEILLAALMGAAAFARPEKFFRIMERYLRHLPPDPAVRAMFQRMMRWFALVLVVHAGLTAVAAVAASKAVWTFVSGPLLYLAFGGFAAVQFARGKLRQRALLRRYRNGPWLPLVTPAGQPAGKAPEALVHQNPRYVHPAVRLIITGPRNSVLIFPADGSADNRELSAVDAAVGCHVELDETPGDAAVRLIRTRLGIERLHHEYVLSYLWRDDRQSELVHLFRGYWHESKPPRTITAAKFAPLKTVGSDHGPSLLPIAVRELELLAGAR